MQQLQHVLDIVAADLTLFESVTCGERAVGGTPWGGVYAPDLGP